jgi:hypothetical protein
MPKVEADVIPTKRVSAENVEDVLVGLFVKVDGDGEREWERAGSGEPELGGGDVFQRVFVVYMERRPELGCGESELAPMGGNTCEEQRSLSTVGDKERRVMREALDEYLCEDFGWEDG